MKNPFNSQKLVKEFDEFRIPMSDGYTGDAFACAFPESRCKAQCKHCFFKSLYKKVSESSIEEECRFSSDGVLKTISFLNDASVKYLLISGGGETMENPEAVCSIVKSVNAEKIVIVTAGYFINTDNGVDILDRIYASYQARAMPCKLIIRVSVDAGHIENLGFSHVTRLIEIFKAGKYSDIELQFHSLIGDTTMHNLAKIVSAKLEDVGENIDEGCYSVVKNTPYESKLSFDDGFSVKVGFAKLFYPSLMKDINDIEALNNEIAVYNKDMKESEHDNPSIAFSNSGYTKGFDFWINNNGNISTWGAQNPHCIHNLYVDDYKTIRHDLLTLVAFRSYLDHGDTYRNSIINEVDPKAVLRTKACNIRDYAGYQILQEDRTRLYWIVRSIQDYLACGTITERDLEGLSDEARYLVLLRKEELRDLYAKSTYDIITQTMRDNFDDADALSDVLLLVKLGHFNVSEESINMALFHYNTLTGNHYHSLDDVEEDCHSVSQYGRLIRRLNRMSTRAYDYCTR